MIKGVDVSSHQSSFETKGLSFVFVKATEGRSYVSPRQAEQAELARDADCAVGFYHFLWPGGIKAQAAYFVEKCASHPSDLLAVDWEWTSEHTAASSAEKDAFIHEVKRLRPKHRMLLYCNRDFWLNRDTSSYAGDGLWVADCTTAGKPRIKAKWRIHQYRTSPLDTNVADFGSTAALRGWATALR